MAPSQGGSGALHSQRLRHIERNVPAPRIKRPLACDALKTKTRPAAKSRTGFYMQKRGGPEGPPLWREAPRASATTLPSADYTAVRRAMAGLAAGFGMGPGDPRLRGRARAGRCPRSGPLQGRPEGRMALLRRKPSFARDRAPGRFRARMARARAISTARLNASRRLQLRPIDLVVYEGPYRRENSSRRRLPA